MSAELEQAIDSALRLAETGRVDAAVAELRTIAARFPGSSEPWRLIGVLALQHGDAQGAHTALEQALRNEPASAAVLCNLGALARSQGDDVAAEQRYRQTLEQDPACVPAHNNLGGLLFDHGRLGEAAQHYRAALDSSAGYAPARSNLAACLLALDRGRDALAEAEQAIRDAPQYAPAWFARARVQHALGMYEDASHAFAHTLALGLRTPDVLYGMAQTLDDLERWPDALASCEEALRLDSSHTPAASLAQYLRRRLCRHTGIDRTRQRLFDLLDAGAEGIAPFAFLSEEATPEQQRRAAELAASETLSRVRDRSPSSAADKAAYGGKPTPYEPLLTPAAGSPPSGIAPQVAHDNIRVGFVSSGFGQHPTALLIVDLIERLRDSTIETIGYATTPDDGGAMRKRLGNAFVALHDLSGLSHDVMAIRIRADRPEVLIDLRGWGGGSVADVFAQRPAPIQVNWLAYPGTSGAPWIDYLLADAFVVPDSERTHYSEALIRLPHCFQPSDTTRAIAAVPTRATLGLPERGVVFACFNNSYKYSPESLSRFWRVLHGVPDSVLWLLDGKHAEIRENLQAMACSADIDPSRLIFLPKQPHATYLACYAHADLFLDTTPYNAHTTASDALWAGCPVLTLPGRTFASRVAGSLNRTLGLDSMNAANEKSFVETAVALGRDATARIAMRQQLAEARTARPLFDMDRFARDFTRAMAAMVDRHRHGETPADVDLTS